METSPGTLKKNQTRPDQTKPNQTNQAKPDQTRPNQAKPNQTPPNLTKNPPRFFFKNKEGGVGLPEEEGHLSPQTSQNKFKKLLGTFF